MRKMILFLLIISLFMGLSSCDMSLNQIDDENQTNEPIQPVDDKKGENIESFERFFDDTKVKTLHVKITNDKWEELHNAMKDYYNQFGHYRTDYMVEADLLYSDEIGTVEINQIGFRTRGNTSRGPIQYDDGNLAISSFKLSFHESYEPKNKNRTAFELEEIDLKNNKNYDSTYLTEKYALDLFSSFGVFSAKTTLVRLLITIGNQEHYYGIYTAFEPIDDNFIKRRLTKEESQGNLYKTLWQQFGPANLGYPILDRAIGMKDEATDYRPSYDLKTNKTENNHTNLEQFIKDINEKTGASFKTYIETHFEVDMFLRYLAVGVMLGNPDDYRSMGNNYYLYQNSLTNKWMIIPYDYDHGLGQGWNGDNLFNDYSIGKDIYAWAEVDAKLLNINDYPHVLVDKILSYNEYQLMYESYLSELISCKDALFSSTSFMAIYQLQVSLYDHLIEGSMFNMRFGLRNVTSYINDKVLDVQNQLTYYSENPDRRAISYRNA